MLLPTDQPPTRELKVSDATIRDKTLIELQLAPSSVLLIRFLSDEFNSALNVSPTRTTMTLKSSLLGRDSLPPLHESILATAVDFPVTQEPRVINTSTPAIVKVQDDKQVNNKLARFLKLHPKP